MRCQKWAVEISKLLEGELSAEREAELRRHLESCRHCQSLEARFRAVSDLLNSPPELPVPDFFAQRITASVSERMRHHSGSRFARATGVLRYRFRVAVMAVTLMVGLLIGGLAGRDIATLAQVGPARPSYDLLVLGEFSAQSGPVDYGLIWHDHGEGGSP
ncbi:MAG: zf-HC2 domain-containing protein [Desulfomonilaceae bacterium]|nr:zf-HC2 domain-containing protein [Desulfomonilaceae bacterium]